MGSGQRKAKYIGSSQGASLRMEERNGMLGRHRHIREVSLNLPSPAIEPLGCCGVLCVALCTALDQTANAYLSAEDA